MTTPIIYNLRHNILFWTWNPTRTTENLKVYALQNKEKIVFYGFKLSGHILVTGQSLVHWLYKKNFCTRVTSTSIRYTTSALVIRPSADSWPGNLFLLFCKPIIIRSSKPNWPSSIILHFHPTTITFPALRSIVDRRRPANFSSSIDSLSLQHHYGSFPGRCSAATCAQRPVKRRARTRNERTNGILFPRRVRNRRRIAAPRPSRSVWRNYDVREGKREVYARAQTI